MPPAVQGQHATQKPWRFKALLLLGSAFPQRCNEVGIRNQTAETMAKEDLMAHPETLGTIYATNLKGFSFTHHTELPSKANDCKQHTTAGERAVNGSLGSSQKHK